MSSTSVNALAPSTSIATKIVIRELVAAADAVHDAAKAMKNCKNDSRKISKLALEIAASVENTAATTQLHGDASLPVAIAAALGATKDVFEQCASFMRDASRRGVLSRQLRRSTCMDTIGGYLATVNGLRDLLAVRDQECALMLRPFVGLEVDVDCTKDVLSTNITMVDAAYDGLKSMLNVMVNITDGLPWPLKAAPQTFLYILKLFEDCQGVQNKISSLLHDVQEMWVIVEEVSKIQEQRDRLLPYLIGFFETLQRIAIRLHTVLRIGKLKRSMAIHTVIACMELEKERLNAARQRIVLVFQAATLIGVEDIAKQMARLDHESKPLTSDMRFSATLPVKPAVFHGREDFVRDAVQLLVQPGHARLAVLGSGGMGKTSVALAILHDTQITAHFDLRRFFISCEAHADADSLIVALATVLGLEASKDLLTVLVACLTGSPRTLLVLDNIETVWLVRDMVKISEVERLLSTLAAIGSLSLIVTCRGNVLPPRVMWSNASTAALYPFSSEAAMKTFEDTSMRSFSGEDKELITQLLHEVDLMPLAVTLLAQLVQRGIRLNEIYDRWIRTRNTLLRTRPVGREYNVDASIEVSIGLMQGSIDSLEPLQLLSICSTLPDGLHPWLFEILRPLFQDIDATRQTLRDYALVSDGVDDELRVLSPIRHFVSANYPLQQDIYEFVCAIYFELAAQLPYLDENSEGLAGVAASEMGNLFTLLFTLLVEPSQQIFDAVINFTNFTCTRKPSTTLAFALLPHLEQHSEWKATCLWTIGNTQYRLDEYREAIKSFTMAGQLYFGIGNQSRLAQCKRFAGDTHRLLGEEDRATTLLSEACDIHAELGEELYEAQCRMTIGLLLRDKQEHAAAIEHLTAARKILNALGIVTLAAQCAEILGMVYIGLEDLESSATELEAAHSAYLTLGNRQHVAHSGRLLGALERRKGNFILAEQLLVQSETYYQEVGERYGLAECAWGLGCLRRDQGRYEEAIRHLESAYQLFEALGLMENAGACRRELRLLQTTQSIWIGFRTVSGPDGQESVEMIISHSRPDGVS